MSVIAGSSLTFEDIIKAPKCAAERAELKPEELFINLNSLQHSKKILEKEVKEILILHGATKKKEETFIAEAMTLESKLIDKEELNRFLQHKYDNLQLEAQRRLERNHQKEELVKQFHCQIQETKLKHRKIRTDISTFHLEDVLRWMQFGNQIEQLMQQHKNIASAFNPQRLPMEIESAECTYEQLQKAEQQKQEQLNKHLASLSNSRNPIDSWRLQKHNMNNSCSAS